MWVTAGGIPEQDKADANIVVDRFRKELKTDYIDLIQLHCMTTGDWTSLQKKQMDILETLKIKGIIRAHGVSVHSFEALEAAAINPWVDVIHIRINPFGDNMDNKDPKMVIPLIEKIHRAGKGIIGMKLIGNGKFKDDSEKVDTSLKFVLGLNRVDLIIVGFEHPEQIDNYLDRIQNALKSKSKI
jgi:predicted aldo/keto reductase-like oxidoreductase